MHVVGDQRRRPSACVCPPPPSCCCRASLRSPAPPRRAPRSAAAPETVAPARGTRRAGRLHAARVGRVVRRVPFRMAGVDEGDELVRRARRPRRPRRRVPAGGGRCRAVSVPYCSCHHIECTTSTESSGVQARGAGAQQQVFPGPRRRGSRARRSRRARTPRLTARSSAGAASITRRATARKPKRRARVSCSSATAPNSSDNSPAA